jgi:hypothetical protein
MIVLTPKKQRLEAMRAESGPEVSQCCGGWRIVFRLRLRSRASCQIEGSYVRSAAGTVN